MNLANKLTVSRIIMTPFFVFFMAFGHMGLGLGSQMAGRVTALAIFIAAIVTDYYDGVLARRHGWITNFGRLMDPLADKLIVAAAFVVFVEERIMPAWMVIIILCREFLITGLRLLGTSQGRVIQADRWGKNKTISQMVAIITALVFLIARDALMLGGVWDRIEQSGVHLDVWMKVILYLVMCVVVFFTLVSGAVYTWQNRDLLVEDTPK